VRRAGESGSSADLVELLADGTGRNAASIAAAHPEVLDRVVPWIRDAAHAGNWSRVDTFANLAAPLPVEGLADVLVEILESGVRGANREDLVEILGEIHATNAAACLHRLVERSAGEDAPAYWLCQKAIGSLGCLGTPEALGFLRLLTAPSWPDPIRWHAAVELGVEDDLGFDERMSV
jgi:hypothetical protein